MKISAAICTLDRRKILQGVMLGIKSSPITDRLIKIDGDINQLMVSPYYSEEKEV